MAVSTTATATIGAVPPGTIIATATFNTDVAISATTEATANTVVTAASFVANGVDQYWMEFYAPSFQTGASLASQINLALYDNGAVAFGAGVSSIAQYITPAAAVNLGAIQIRMLLTPSAAAHAYSIRAWRVVADGQVRGSGGGAYQPGRLTIIKAA